MPPIPKASTVPSSSAKRAAAASRSPSWPSRRIRNRSPSRSISTSWSRVDEPMETLTTSFMASTSRTGRRPRRAPPRAVRGWPCPRRAESTLVRTRSSSCDVDRHVGAKRRGPERDADDLGAEDSLHGANPPVARDEHERVVLLERGDGLEQLVEDPRRVAGLDRFALVLRQHEHEVERMGLRERS